MGARWSEPDPGPNKNPAVEERDRDLFDRLMSAEIPSCGELLKEENLVEAELAPAMAMKFDNAAIQEAVRRKRQRAGKVVQPTRRARRRAQVNQAPTVRESEPVVAPTAPAEGVPVERTEPARGASGGTSTGRPARDDAPQATVPAAVDGTGGPSEEVPAEEPSRDAAPTEAAPTREIRGRAVIVYSPLVWTGLRTERVAPTRPESMGGEERAEVAAEPAAESEERAAEGPAAMFEEPAAPPAEEGPGEEPARGGGEAADPTTPAANKTARCAVKKMSAGPYVQPRPAPRLSAMEDAR